MTPAWPDEDDGLLDHHPPCPCGKELADECMGPGNGCPLARPNPLGAFRIEAPIGSRPAPHPPAQDR